jgi:2-methylcitrate dehydratase
MEVVEEEAWSRDYHDPDKRSIANAVQVFFRDGSATERVAVEYPVGHRRRREEGVPILRAKFEDALATRFPRHRAERILELCGDDERLARTPVHEFVDELVI